MKKIKPMPKRPKYSEKLRAMKPGAYLFLAGISPESGKAIASRIGTNSKPPRIYYTAKERSGVSFWRET